MIHYLAHNEELQLVAAMIIEDIGLTWCGMGMMEGF